MSLNAIYELIIHLGKFRNVGLKDQGQYMMSIMIHFNTKEEIEYAKPYYFFQTNKQLKCKKKHKITREQQLNNTSYQTKRFKIKYTDQQIDLQETVVFRLELPTFPKVNTVQLVLNLHYIENQNIQDLDQSRFELLIADSPIKNYSDVNFRKCKSLATMFLFSTMIDYKFRTYHGPKDTTLNKQKYKILSLKQYFQFYQKQTKKPLTSIYKEYIKSLRICSETAKYQWSKLIIENDLPFQCHIPKYYKQQNSTSLQSIQIDWKLFYQQVRSFKISEPSLNFFQQEIQLICTQCYSYQQLFLSKISQGKLNTFQLKMKYELALKQRFGQYILKNNIASDQIICDKFKGKQKQILASVFRKNKDYGKMSFNYPIVDLLEKQLTDRPLLFHEITPLRKQSQNDIQLTTRDLLVFCHGLAGKSIDMLPIRNMFKKLCPSGLFLMIKANQNKTDSNILTMGQKTAEQIIEYIDTLKLEKCVTIHMIGHSMGGIIIRAAIPYLAKFKGQFGLYMSFSTPHLSYLKQTTTSVDVGMWLLRKIRKNSSLNELTMNDNVDPKQSLLFKLSTAGSLKVFKKVILVSSFQDKYVPWHSARIHESQKTLNDPIVQLQKQMSFNLLSGGSINSIHRIQVSLDIAQRNFDSFVGRAAHIRLLSDQNILKLISYCIQQIFN